MQGVQSDVQDFEKAVFAMEEFRRLARLPAYVFNVTGDLKAAARKRGEDIIDFGMGNPDGATPEVHRR